MSDRHDGEGIARRQEEVPTDAQNSGADEARKLSGLEQEAETRQEKALPNPSLSATEAKVDARPSLGGELSASTMASGSDAPPPPPSVHKRNLRSPPKGILKPAPPPTKAFSFRRDILQQLNARLAQQGVNVQVPVPQGSLAGTAQGTAQAAGNLLGGMLRKVSGFASSYPSVEENSSHQHHHHHHLHLHQAHHPHLHAQHAAQAAAENVPRQTGSSTGPAQPQRVASVSSISSDSTLVGSGSSAASAPPSVHATSTNNLPHPSSSARPLRKVRFTVSNMAVIYPISGAISPGEEDITRRRIEQEHRLKLKERRERKWTISELEQLYRECCRTREELPLRKMRQVFQDAKQAVPPVLKAMDLSFVPLDRHAIEPVADLLSVDFGLQKLVLENCGLTDEGIKSILHSLLVSGTLSSLSLASNKRVKYHGWRYIGIYMRRAKSLKYLDLSENTINRASVEHILEALSKRDIRDVGKSRQDDEDNNSEGEEGEGPLTIKAKLLAETMTSEVANLTSLRMENCGLKTPSLEMLANAVRYSDLSHLSLRRNRINQIGAVALAVLLKDHPDSQIATAEHATPNLSHEEGSIPSVARSQSGFKEDARGRSGPGDGSSYLQAVRSSSPGLPNIPVIVSSPGGGVTRRTLPSDAIAALQEASNDDFRASNNGQASHDQHARDSKRLMDEHSQSKEASLALYHAQRAKKILSSMPRMGNLLTLDLKSNDIRGGIVYLSHALKKNRTLKVLNLSDNNIEVMGLVAIADALKYNSTLETLDLSHNPCSGPALDGITNLRNAFTLNSNLKRLFLSDTELSSEGAIALAEFLPEARSLIHLDLTENLQIDIAGVMAMAVSVKMNKSLRCLDLNIPPNAPDFARLSQDILNSCIRNTELAQRRAQQKGVKAPIPAPIYKSALARAAKEKEESARLHAANQQLEQQAQFASPSDQSPSSRAPKNLNRSDNSQRVTDAAWECVLVLRELMEREKEQEIARQRDREVLKHPDGSVAPRPMGDFARDLMIQSKQLRSKLKKALSDMQEGELLGRALQVNDDLESITLRLREFYAGKDHDQGEVSDKTAESLITGESTASIDRLQVPPLSGEEDGLTSPNFSIGSSDDEEEEESGQAARLAATAAEVISSTADTALSGLGIEENQAAEVQQRAAREAPVEEEVDPDSEMVNKRAKGQLSEEGEIFRRARSLSIGEEEDENVGDDEKEADEYGIGKSEENGRESNESSAAADSALLVATTTKADRTPDINRTVSEDGSTDDVGGSVASEDRKGVSGEELRKELLEKVVPRRSQTNHASAPSASEISETNE